MIEAKLKGEGIDTGAAAELERGNVVDLMAALKMPRHGASSVGVACDQRPQLVRRHRDSNRSQPRMHIRRRRYCRFHLLLPLALAAQSPLVGHFLIVSQTAQLLRQLAQIDSALLAIQRATRSLRLLRGAAQLARYERVPSGSATNLDHLPPAAKPEGSAYDLGPVPSPDLALSLAATSYHSALGGRHGAMWVTPGKSGVREAACPDL
jgi:hypothetical protein